MTLEGIQASHKLKLVVLAAPKGKRGPAIEVTWNLATRDHAYLDYTPEQVAHFEAAVSRLPEAFAQVERAVESVGCANGFQIELDCLIESNISFKDWQDFELPVATPEAPSVIIPP